MKARQIQLLLCVLAVASCAPKIPEGPLPIPAEVRAVWVVRYTLDHPDSVRTMVRRADEAGFNTLIVQVRGRGDAFYDGRWEPKAETLYKEDFDPLQLLVKEAHKRRIAVHVWLNTHLVANAEAMPTRPGHVIYTHPEILAVPQPIARDLYDMDPRDPRFVEALAQYARDNADHVEGLYTSPAAPEVKEHLYSIWMDILEKYDVDGMHFDYVRYPAPDYDYSRPALERFRRWLEPQLADSVAEYYAMLQPEDPLVYTDSFPEAWDRFRREQITALVERVYYGVKKRKPNVVVSAYLRRYQDWLNWLRLGILDVACPMAYSPDTEIFREQISVALEAGGRDHVWAGIGAWRIPVESTLEKIEVARQLGTRGIVLFSYDSTSRNRDDFSGESVLQRIGELAF
jgi:uncharacterized lipoprotein YddW (UPF0748 family)